VPVSDQEANDVFIALLRVQKLLIAARHTAPRVHDGVDVTAYPVLFVIANAGSVRVSDIANSLHSDVSTVSRQVSALAGHGLVAKVADPSDGRAQVASLTDEGRSVLRQIQSTRATWFQGLLTDWDGTDAAAFISQLRSLGDALDGHLRARGAPLPILPFDSTQEN
jgi:DNA-binding MarR family transcriptional regulator